MPKIITIEETIDQGVQVQPKNGREMKQLLLRAKATVLRLEAENQALKRRQNTRRLQMQKPDCDAETSTDDIPKRRGIIKRYKDQEKKYKLDLEAAETLRSIMETGGVELKKVYRNSPSTRIKIIDNVKEGEEKRYPSKSLQNSKLLFNKKVSEFQNEMNTDFKKMLRHSNKVTPQVAALRDSFDRIGKMIANLKSDLKGNDGEKRSEIIGKLREISKSPAKN